MEEAVAAMKQTRINRTSISPLMAAALVELHRPIRVAALKQGGKITVRRFNTVIIIIIMIIIQ